MRSGCLEFWREEKVDCSELAYLRVDISGNRSVVDHKTRLFLFMTANFALFRFTSIGDRCGLLAARSSLCCIGQSHSFQIPFS